MHTICVEAGDDLQAVFDAAPENAVIRLGPGLYRQKLVIRTPGLTLAGAGAAGTRIVWGDFAGDRDFLGAPRNTFRSYTLAVCADGVSISDLTVENDAGAPEKKGQQVALSVCGDAFRMERCLIRSTQDTLFLGPLPYDLVGRYEGFLEDGLRRWGRFRQTFFRCRVEGTVDFIFGCGDGVFTQCTLRSVKDARHTGYVAAPAHEKDQSRGFLFDRCVFDCEEDVPTASVYLARPWRSLGKAEFVACRYGRHICPEGFDKWNDTCRDQTARFYETPPVPGRVSWVNQDRG